MVANAVTTAAAPPVTATRGRPRAGVTTSSATTTEDTAVVCPLGRLLWVAGVISRRPRSGRVSKCVFSSQVDALAAISSPTAVTRYSPLPRQCDKSDRRHPTQQSCHRYNRKHRVDRVDDPGVGDQGAAQRRVAELPPGRGAHGQHVDENEPEKAEHGQRAGSSRTRHSAW